MVCALVDCFPDAIACVLCAGVWENDWAHTIFMNQAIAHTAHTHLHKRPWMKTRIFCCRCGNIHNTISTHNHPNTHPRRKINMSDVWLIECWRHTLQRNFRNILHRLHKDYVPKAFGEFSFQISAEFIWKIDREWDAFCTVSNLYAVDLNTDGTPNCVYPLLHNPNSNPIISTCGRRVYVYLLE